MRFSIDDWQFDIDRCATCAYSLQEYRDNCQCEVCLYFYRTVESIYPLLRSFLDKFGAHIFAPDEMLSYAYDTLAEYSLAYKVYGQIVSFGKAPILVNDIKITAEINDDDSFFLTFSLMLPNQ